MSDERLRDLEVSQAKTTAVLERVEIGVRDLSTKVSLVAERQAEQHAQVQGLVAELGRRRKTPVRLYAALVGVGAAVAWGPKALAAILGFK